MGILNDPRAIRDANTINHDDVQGLFAKFPPVPQFTDEAQITALTLDQALEVLRATRRQLVSLLLNQEHHEHMADDCGDDLRAGLDGFNLMFEAWDEAVDDAEFVELVRQYLRARWDSERFPWGACDGEARYAMLSEALHDDRWKDLETPNN